MPGRIPGMPAGGQLPEPDPGEEARVFGSFPADWTHAAGGTLRGAVEGVSGPGVSVQPATAAWGSGSVGGKSRTAPAGTTGRSRQVARHAGAGSVGAAGQESDRAARLDAESQRV